MLKEEYFVTTAHPEEESFELSQLHALIVNPYGLFKLGSDRSVTEWTRFGAIGCGEEIALGAMQALYSRRDDPTIVAKAGVEAACDLQLSLQLARGLSRSCADACGAVVEFQ